MSKSKTNGEVVIRSAGGTGLYIAATVKRIVGWQVAGFLDDDSSKSRDDLLDIPVLGGLAAWRQLPENCLFVSSLYGAKKMPRFYELVESLRIPDERWAIVVDPYSVVFSGAEIGQGSFVGPGSVVEPKVKLGRCCALLGNVYLGHDTHLHDYVACANSVSSAGRVKIGQASYIGANATIREDTTIGAAAVVGMASAVLNDVCDGGIVVGNPARPLPTGTQSPELRPQITTTSLDLEN